MLSIKNNNNNIGCVSDQALSPVYLIKVDFAKLLVFRVKSLAQWLGIGFVPGRLGFDSHRGQRNISAMLYFVTSIML